MVQTNKNHKRHSKQLPKHQLHSEAMVGPPSTTLWRRAGMTKLANDGFYILLITMWQLASCLIYARAFIEYVCACVLFQDVTVREIRGR